MRESCENKRKLIELLKREMSKFARSLVYILRAFIARETDLIDFKIVLFILIDFLLDIIVHFVV